MVDPTKVAHAEVAGQGGRPTFWRRLSAESRIRASAQGEERFVGRRPSLPTARTERAAPPADRGRRAARHRLRGALGGDTDGHPGAPVPELSSRRTTGRSTGSCSASQPASASDPRAGPRLHVGDPGAPGRDALRGRAQRVGAADRRGLVRRRRAIEAENLEFVPMPDWVSLTDWAEDGYVSLKDAADDSGYLMEPWSFPRAGDSLIADAVEEYTELKASGAPLVFQGGNCLVGERLLAAGHRLLRRHPGPPGRVTAAGLDATRRRSRGSSPRGCSATYVDATRRLILVGTRRPIPLRDFVGTHETGTTSISTSPSEGAGTFQPIFHIDMFVTLVGPGADGAFEVLVGSPRLADERLGVSSPVRARRRLRRDRRGVRTPGLRGAPGTRWCTDRRSARRFRSRELKELAIAARQRARSCPRSPSYPRPAQTTRLRSRCGAGTT